MLFVMNHLQESKRRRKKVVERFSACSRLDLRLVSTLQRQSRLLNNKLPFLCSTLLFPSFTGIEYLYENHLLKTDEQDVAQFLYKGEGLNKTAIGEANIYYSQQLNSCGFIFFHHQAIIWARRSHSTRKCWKLLSNSTTFQISSWCKL